MNDINVISYNRLSDTEIECTIDISQPLRMDQNGIQMLVQIVAMWLLKSPGRDYYEPELGGGLLELVGPHSYELEGDMVRANIKDAIKATEYQIKRSQLGRNYPANERLAKLEIRKKDGILIFDDTNGYLINMELTSEAGEKAEFAVPVIPEE